MAISMLSLNIDKLKKIFFNKNLYSIYLLVVISVSLPAIWMHGRIIYFWDGILPFKTSSDFHYLNFYWNQLNGLGYGTSIDKYNVYILSYYFFQTFTRNIALTQYLLLSILITSSTLGMYFLLKHLTLLVNTNVNNIFPFIGSLFYILNFYFALVFSDFGLLIYLYSLLPLDVLVFSKVIESFNNTKLLFTYTVIFGVLLELTSYSFILVPMLVFFIFTIISFLFIFMKYIWRTKLNLIVYIKNISIFIFTVLMMNIWWIIGYFINFKSESASTAISGLSTIVIDFTTNGYYPLKILSTISLYPQLTPIKYANNWFWIVYYYPKYLLFPIISISLFVIILIPLIFLRNINPIFNRSLKIKIYIITFIILFFALQGINPINSLIFYYIKDNYPALLVDLYGTRLPFMRMPLLFFYTIIFYDSIYEIYNFSFRRRTKNKIQNNYKKIRLKFLNKQTRAYLIVIILILLLIVYPFYLYTPYTMQTYDTGHGNVPETVVFPKYFYRMADYINTHANNSDTLILPLTYDMLSMNFSQCNGFADDNYAGLLTGSPVIDGGNSTLFNLINKDINFPHSNFSILLNNINVEYILINPIYDKYVHGYPCNTNISQIITYVNSQKSIKLVQTFGPLLVYKNLDYKGIITSGNTMPNNFSLYSSDNYISVLPDFSTINTTFNTNISGYENMTYSYSSLGINLSFPFSTSKLFNGYYFTNNQTLNINISKYHYLIITAKSANGNLCNGTYFAVNTYTYLNNNSATSSYIKPLYSSTYDHGNSSFTTYIYQLYNNILDNNSGYYNLENGGNDGINRFIEISVSWYLNSTFPSYLNISNVGFAKELNGISSLLETDNIISPYNVSTTVPKISYSEINPTLYKVSVANATGSFDVILRQNYNAYWSISGIPNSETEHFTADYIENGWVVDKTGNYTFYIEYTPQKVYSTINDIILSANALALTGVIFILAYRRRYIK